jgi:hypothetical protein
VRVFLVIAPAARVRSQREQPKKKLQPCGWSFFFGELAGSNWNTYWDGFVRLSKQLEEAGIDEIAL